MNPPSLGLLHFWQQGDLVAHAVIILLFLLSLASWTITLTRFVLQLRLNKALEEAPQHFWQSASFREAIEAVEAADRTGLFSGLARAAIGAADTFACPAGRPSSNASGKLADCQACPQAGVGCHAARSLGAGVTLSESITRSLRNQMFRAQASLESGLTFLASVGSTAPFIGLFGTVWGIYHALESLSGASEVVLDKVAGPVGEALIMTAAGLFVAIPAVLAYNALVRGNRLVLAQMDAFAHDLHASLTSGIRKPPEDRGGERPVVLASAGAA